MGNDVAVFPVVQKKENEANDDDNVMLLPLK